MIYYIYCNTTNEANSYTHCARSCTNNKIMIVHATYLTCIHTIYSPTLNSKYCLMVGVMLIREIVDISLS